MIKLWLVRHGETIDNVNQIMQGQTQGELTQAGIEQARDLARRFMGKSIDVFVCSDLKRSVDTCRIIAAPHDKDVVRMVSLRERDWGGFTGRYIPDLKEETWPDDVESLSDLLARAKMFLDTLRERYEGKTVLAVGHGIINKAIQAVHLGKEMRDVPRMTNAEVRTLYID